MAMVSIAIFYGMVAGAIFGYAVGVFMEELQKLNDTERVLLAFVIAFWPITLVWYYLKELCEES